jgi:hypothetical protein
VVGLWPTLLAGHVSCYRRNACTTLCRTPHRNDHESAVNWVRHVGLSRSLWDDGRGVPRSP